MKITVTAVLGVLLLPGSSALAALPPAPGPYISPGWTDFSGISVDEQDWQVGTFYFFWYNTKNGMHILDPDGTDACTTHYYKWIPGTLSYSTPPVFAWDEPAWVEEQIEDMLTAGIDFLMPVYWGVPGAKDWNIEGVTTLAQVLLDREAKGKPSPKVGLFYDTSTLEGVDLSSQAGKEKFYGTIRDFYSMVPPRFWNRRDGKVFAWLYHSAFPSKKDDAAFTYSRSQFAADFGGTQLWFVADQGWKDAGCSVDRVYSWGGALAEGPKLLDYCEVGPGFDNTAVPWGSASLTQPRNGGAFYASGWQKAVGHPCRVTAVETWNEWHESTDIAHSFEYGTQYIQLTASWATKFRFKGSYINAAYRYLLGRLPDKSGKQSYGDMLAGNPPSAVRNDLLESPEAKDVLSNDPYITFLYKHYLHRDPDAGGLKNYQDFLAGGGTRAQARDHFLNSPEANSKVPDAQFVSELYRQILFREPDDEGLGTYTGLLAQGVLRSTVRDYILDSAEFTEKKVGEKGLADLAGVFDFAGWPKQGTWCTPYYKDKDGDGVGNGNSGKCLYAALPPFSTTSGADCNDSNPQVKPGVQELCNGVDDNCSGSIDEGLGTVVCGLGPCNHSVESCVGGVPKVCDPLQGSAPETCDGVDNDCDGQVDEGTLNSCGQCGPVPGEVCDGVDNDCDGQVDEGTLNSCGQCGPVPEEVCDGQDNDCDGQVDEGTLNSCGQCGPVPEEVCDGQDNDCDGQVDEGCAPCTEGQIQSCDPSGEDCTVGMQVCTGGMWGDCLATCPEDDIVEIIDVAAPDASDSDQQSQDVPLDAPDAAGHVDALAGDPTGSDWGAAHDAAVDAATSSDSWFTLPGDEGGKEGNDGQGSRSGGCSASKQAHGETVLLVAMLLVLLTAVRRRGYGPPATVSSDANGLAGDEMNDANWDTPGLGGRSTALRAALVLLLAIVLTAACGGKPTETQQTPDAVRLPGLDISFRPGDATAEQVPGPDTGADGLDSHVDGETDPDSGEADAGADGLDSHVDGGTNPDSGAQDVPPADTSLDVLPPDVCVPACAGKQCGDDGCGGSCGNCPADQSCQDGACKPGPCVSQCAGKQCGDDGCGGSCGNCPADQSCQDGACKPGPCVSQCAGKQCGDDGCGGSCGNCPADQSCQDGACKPGPCVSQCAGKQCGDDGCGGSCGTCAPDHTCQDGACTFSGVCAAVPQPEPVSDDPLPALSPPGPAETIQEGGFTDDYLLDPTSYIKVGTRREWGSTIVFFGLAKGKPGMNSSNTIDANDTGREVQIALYDPLRAMQGCAWNASCQSNPGAACPGSITYLGWDPVQGGNECNIGSGTEWVDIEPGILRAEVRPLFWNPDWKEPGCANAGCSDPGKKAMKSDVRYTQRLRFVATHVVEMQMTLENLSDLDHPTTGQEFPTLYAVYGNGGTADLKVLLDSNGNQVAIDIPANDGFFYKNFSSPGGWVTLQNASKDYGVGIYYENRLTGFQGWQKLGVFNNVRSQFSFALTPFGTVKARAYLILGAFGTVADEAAALDSKLPPFGALDSPKADAGISGLLHVSGWVLDNKGVTKLVLRRDGIDVAELAVGSSRPDVCLVYPGYTMCDKVGFEGDVSVAGWSPCPHLLEVAATDTDGNVRVIARIRVFANGAPSCAKDADCDDGDPCTQDSCAGAAGCKHDKLPCLPGTHPIYRFYASNGGDGDHMFQADPAPPAGYSFEGQHFTLFDGPAPGLVPLHQLYCAACFDHLQSTDANEGAPAFQDEGVLGYCSSAPIPEAGKELRRLYSAAASDHFVSASPQEWNEAQASGYVLEGTVCYVP